jgi:5-methylcytosine-specific restriction endonuclease McrA
MAISIEEKRKRDRDRHRVINHAAAVAAGREPGRIGQPPKPAEHRAAVKAAAVKRSSVRSLKRRTAQRAERAIVQGRTPGRPGKKKVLVTEAQIKSARNARAKKYRDSHLVEVRAADLARNAVRMPLLKETDPIAYKLRCAATAHGYRARRMGACSPRGLTAVLRRVWVASGQKCACCPSTDRLEFDHIVALFNGGDNAESNFRVLCKSCNSSKGVKDYQTWLESRPALERIAA